MPVPSLRRIEYRFTVAGIVKCSTGFHVHDGAGADTYSSLFDIATAVAATGAGGLKDAFLGMLASDDVLDEIHVRQVADPSTPAEPLIGASVFPNAAGTRGAITWAIPIEACPTITLQTGIGGKRFRGRMFLPGPRNSASVDKENFTTSGTYWTALNAWVTQLSKLLNSSGSHLSGALSLAELVVFSKVAYAADHDFDGAEVLAIRLNSKVHWLRSRAK